jgi:hypothetical protein
MAKLASVAGWLMATVSGVLFITALAASVTDGPVLYYVAGAISAFVAAAFFFALDHIITLLTNICAHLTWLMPKEYEATNAEETPTLTLQDDQNDR